MKTRETTFGQLQEGDIIIAIEGKPRPFPYTVIRVDRFLNGRLTSLRYAHGGFIPASPSRTGVTVSA